MHRIRRFGVIKTATVVAVMYMLVIAIFIVLAALYLIFVTPQYGGAGAVGTLIVGIFVALLYGVGAWIFTAIACVLYNVVAGWVGGIEIQLETVAPPPPAPVWGPMTTTSPPTAPPPPATPQVG